MTITKARVEVDDAIVLLLGAPTTTPSLEFRIEGVTRLEKLIYLLERETELKEFVALEDAEFEAHNFGPFSSKIYMAVDTLAAAELVEDSAKLAPSSEDLWEAKEVAGSVPAEADPYITRNITLTDRGQRYYKAIVQELPESTETMLSGFKDRFGALPLRELIRYVYERYPEDTGKSLIKNDILR